MKNRVLILAVFFYGKLFGQQVTNGGMEQWDTTFTPYPVSWLTNGFYASLPCNPFVPLTAERTSDKNSGVWAAKLESKVCIDDSGVPQIYIGYLAYGNTSNPNLAHGIPYNQRPDNLHFYYKFSRVGTDTAFAKVVLRFLDSTGYAGQIIGEGKVSLINDTNIYTLITVPINYLLPDTPDIIQIVFATSKTLADHEYFPLNTTSGNGANTGTILWIDDITVSGGTLGIKENQEINTCIIFPNPIHNFSTITFENSKKENHTLKIFDCQGRLVKTVSNIKTSQIIIERTSLASGLYFFQLGTDQQLISTQKFIVE